MHEYGIFPTPSSGKDRRALFGGDLLAFAPRGPYTMNRRTADRIRLLSKQLLQERDDKRISTLAAELRSELQKHLKHLRDRLAISEIRERRVRDGVTYDFDEVVNPAAPPSLEASTEKSNRGGAVAGDPPSPPTVASTPAQAEPQVQAREGDPPQGGGPEIKAS